MSEFDFSKYSVLMADPSPQSIERAQAVYDLKGLSRFKGVTTTSKALAELKTFRPHIAFIDMDPGSGGLETIQMIRDHPDGRVSEVPIIILITKVDTNTLKKVCKVGIEGALRKPFDPVRLLRITRLTIIRPQRFISIRSYFGPNRRNKDIGAFDGYDRRKKHPQAEGFTPKGKEDPRLVPLENSGGSGKQTSYKDLRSDGGKGAQSSYVPVRDRPSAERGLKSKSDDSPSWEAIQAGKGKSELSYKPIEGFGTQGEGKDPSWEAMKKEGRDGEISYKAIEGFGTDGKDGDQSWEAIKKEGRDGEISYKAIEGFGTDGKDGGPSWEAMQRDGKEGGASWEEMKKEGREGELSYKAIEGFGKDDPDYNFEEKAAQANEDLKYTPVGTLSEKGDISNADIRAFEEKGEMTFDQMSDDALLAEYGDAFDAEMKAALEGEDAGFINVADLIGKSGGNTMDVMNADELLSGAKSEKAEPEAKRKRPQAKPPRIELEPEEPKKGIADIPTPEPKKKGMSIAAALEAAEKAKRKRPKKEE